MSRLRWSINHFARVLRAEKADVPLAEVLDRRSFGLERILEMEPGFLSEQDDHTRDEQVSSVSLTSDVPLAMERFNQWFGIVLMEKGQDIPRTKGVLHFKDEHDRFAFQAVHMIADGDYIGASKPGDVRQSRIVFIGRALNRSQVRRGFAACAGRGRRRRSKRQTGENTSCEGSFPGAACSSEAKPQGFCALSTD